MEDIERIMEDGWIAVPIIGIIAFAMFGIIAGVFSGPNIMTDQAFRVTSDTSKYSCVISEVDKDLALNCLRVK